MKALIQLVVGLCFASSVFAAPASNYPLKETPNSEDKVLITDSQAGGALKQIVLNYFATAANYARNSGVEVRADGLVDIKIRLTDDTYSPLVDPTVNYGDVDDHIRVPSIQKVGAMIATAIESVDGRLLEIGESETDPSFSTMSPGQIIVSSQTDGLYIKTQTGGLFIAGTYTADPVIPTLVSATVGTLGLYNDLVFSVPTSVGTGGGNGWSMNCSSSGTIAMTYSSGLSYSLTPTPIDGEACTITYAQPGDGLEATTGGGDLASITTPFAVTNNSEVAGEAGVTYVGFSNVDGVPNAIVDSDYGAIDVVVTRPFTAPAAITLTTINGYVDNRSGTIDHESLVVYKDVAGVKTLIATGSYTGTAATWTGNVTLTAVSGQSLNVESGAVLYFGGCGSSNNQYKFGRNDTGGPGQYQATAGDFSSGPPATIVFTSSADRNGAFILGYTLQ